MNVLAVAASYRNDVGPLNGRDILCETPVASNGAATRTPSTTWTDADIPLPTGYHWPSQLDGSPAGVRGRRSRRSLRLHACMLRADQDAEIPDAAQTMMPNSTCLQRMLTAACLPCAYRRESACTA